jgi:ABC-type sugar transport system ATPase subunit
MSKNPIVQFKGITKKFPGVLALSDINLSINPGEIHSIVGENGAGKSTLMNILGGLYTPSNGIIYFNGEEVSFANEQASLLMGIAVVYQELKLCPNMNITENIFLGRELKNSKKRLDWKLMRLESEKVLKSLGVNLSPDTLVKSLSIAEQQVIEIAKSLSRDIKVLVLDEPTSALTISESQKLFENIQKLRDQGVAVIYISHRLEEVMELSDRISVLRDGIYRGTFNSGEVDITALVKLIAGDKLLQVLENQSSEEKKTKGDELPYFRVENLSSVDGSVKDVSFSLYRGEILGFYGVQGAGRTELLETIFGLRKMKEGSIFLEDKLLENTNPIAAIKNGFAMVPEDRRRSGLFPNMNIVENINISNSDDISSGLGWLDKKNMESISEKYRSKIGIKTKDIFENIMHLSGGNQQKVIIGRWLASHPKVFLVDELTRGVDVGAKAEIFSVLRMLRDNGLGIILVSSELQELIAESDRVLVLKDGKIVTELTGANINKDQIVKHALIGD